MFSSLRKLLRNFQEVALNGKHPPETSFIWMKEPLRIIGLRPKRLKDESIFYLMIHFLGLFAMVSFVLSITFDLYEASSQFDILGDDLCVLIGLYLILFKTCFSIKNQSKIDEIIEDFENRHKMIIKSQDPHILQLTRRAYLVSTSLLFANGFLGDTLFIAICMQPLFSGDRSLPFRAKFPFSTELNAIYYATFIYQCICTIYNLKAITYSEHGSITSLYQIYLHLQIICYNLKKLAEKGDKFKNICLYKELREIIIYHQSVISIKDKVNDRFRSHYTAQVAGSMFMICLTAFEATLEFDSTLYKLKFLVYMLAAFLQLLYWCWAGNLVRYQSTEVADLAYKCNWIGQSKEFQYAISFMIFRSQKPLIVIATPLHCFDYDSFLNILSGSYSYFTLLRTLHM